MMIPRKKEFPNCVEIKYKKYLKTNKEKEKFMTMSSTDLSSFRKF